MGKTDISQFRGQRGIATVLVVLVGVAPLWGAAGPALDENCATFYRQTIESKLSPGDSLAVIYRDGTKIDGRFVGLSGDGRAFLLVREGGPGGMRSEHPLVNIHSLHYRDVAGVRPGTVLACTLSGALLGLVGGVLVAGAVEDKNSDELFPSALLVAPAGLVLGAAVGLVTGLLLPRPAGPGQTIRCEAE
jgi:hypothetical protein